MTVSASCIVPTYNRQDLHPHLYAVFARQTYPLLDLWVLDDTPAGPSPFFLDLDDADPRVHYGWVGKRATIGAKRNRLIAHAGGDVIVHIDDDDFYAPNYVQTMIARLGAADLAKLVVWDSMSAYDGSRWRWDTRRTGGGCYAVTGAGPAQWARHCAEDSYGVQTALLGYGFSYVYRRAVWEQAPFEDLNLGEDLEFVRALGARGGRLVFIDDQPSIALHTLHRKSSSRIYPQIRLTQGAAVEGEEGDAPAWSWATSWAGLWGAPRISFRAGRTYRVTAHVKDWHSTAELLRRARAYGEVVSLLDPAGPASAAGYRPVQATIRTTKSGAIPKRVPAPFSILDHSEIVRVD